MTVTTDEKRYQRDYYDPDASKNIFCETCKHSECNIHSRPTDITDTRKRLAANYAVQNGKTDEPGCTQQTRDNDSIVTI